MAKFEFKCRFVEGKAMTHALCVLDLAESDSVVNVRFWPHEAPSRLYTTELSASDTDSVRGRDVDLVPEPPTLDKLYQDLVDSASKVAQSQSGRFALFRDDGGARLLFMMEDGTRNIVVNRIDLAAAEPLVACAHLQNLLLNERRACKDAQDQATSAQTQITRIQSSLDESIACEQQRAADELARAKSDAEETLKQWQESAGLERAQQSQKIQELEEQLSSATQQIDELRQELDRVRGAHKQTQDQLRAHAETSDSAQRDVADAHQRLEQMSQDLRASEKNVAVLEAQLEATKAVVADVNQRYNEAVVAREKAAEFAAKATEGQRSADEDRRRLEAEVARLTEQTRQLSASLESLQREHSAACVQNETMNERVRSLEEKLKQGQAELSKVLGQLEEKARTAQDQSALIKDLRQSLSSKRDEYSALQLVVQRLQTQKTEAAIRRMESPPVIPKSAESSPLLASVQPSQPITQSVFEPPTTHLSAYRPACLSSPEPAPRPADVSFDFDAITSRVGGDTLEVLRPFVK